MPNAVDAELCPACPIAPLFEVSDYASHSEDNAATLEALHNTFRIKREDKRQEETAAESQHAVAVQVCQGLRTSLRCCFRSKCFEITTVLSNSNYDISTSRIFSKYLSDAV